MPDTLRLFVAVYPPASAAEDLLATLARVDLPRHRTTPAPQIHMTLQFIGDTAKGDLGAVAESVERSAAGIGPIRLTPERLRTLPRRGPARLIAAQTDAPPPLLEIQRRLAHRLARSPRDHAGDRFLPHFTLCRFAGGGAPRFDLDQALDLPPFEIERVALMRSTLRAEGAVHSEVASAMLRG